MVRYCIISNTILNPILVQIDDTMQYFESLHIQNHSYQAFGFRLTISHVHVFFYITGSRIKRLTIEREV